MSSKCLCWTHWLKNKRKTIPLDPNCSKLSSLSTLSIIFMDWKPWTKMIKLLSSIMHGLREKKASTSLDTEWPGKAKLKQFFSGLLINMETWTSISASKEKPTCIHITSKPQTLKYKFKANTLNNWKRFYSKKKNPKEETISQFSGQSHWCNRQSKETLRQDLCPWTGLKICLLTAPLVRKSTLDLTVAFLETEDNQACKATILWAGMILLTPLITKEESKLLTISRDLMNSAIQSQNQNCPKDHLFQEETIHSIVHLQALEEADSEEALAVDSEVLEETISFDSKWWCISYFECKLPKITEK